MTFWARGSLTSHNQGLELMFTLSADVLEDRHIRGRKGDMFRVYENVSFFLQW